MPRPRAVRVVRRPYVWESACEAVCFPSPSPLNDKRERLQGCRMKHGICFQSSSPDGDSCDYFTRGESFAAVDGAIAWPLTAAGARGALSRWRRALSRMRKAAFRD